MMVTPLYAGLLAVWFLVLCIRIIQYRGAAKINLGDGGDPHMVRLQRAQANFTEYVPLILLMMALLEVSHASIYVLHVLGAVLLLARLLHGYALSFTANWMFGRFWGTLLTFILLLVAALLCMYQGVQGQLAWSGMHG